MGVAEWSFGLLVLGTSLCVVALSWAPRLGTAAVSAGTAGGVSWLLSNRPFEAAVLVEVSETHALVLADVYAAPAALMVAVLVTRSLRGPTGGAPPARGGDGAAHPEQPPVGSETPAGSCERRLPGGG